MKLEVGQDVIINPDYIYLFMDDLHDYLQNNQVQIKHIERKQHTDRFLFEICGFPQGLSVKHCWEEHYLTPFMIQEKLE